MRIEILIDGSVEPQIYPLNKPKLVLGSGETCDVIVSSTNVSRKHLIIVTEGDTFHVIDQGSTNGSFINEERLVPGRRTEFTSFFPVRLGTDVLISLLSDEGDVAGDDPEPLIPLPSRSGDKNSGRGDESTKMISLADLKKAKTTDLQAKRQTVIKNREAKKAPPKKKSKRQSETQKFKFLMWVMIIGVSAIGYYNFKGRTSDEVKMRKIGEIDASVAPAGRTQVEETKVEPQPLTELIPDEQLLPKDRVFVFLSDAKCITDLEKYLCDKITGNEGQLGVVQVGTTFHILVKGEQYIVEARGIVVHPPADAEGKYPPQVFEPYKKTVMDTALALFFLRGFPADFDWEKYKDAKFSVALVDVYQEKNVIAQVGAGYAASILKLREVIQEESIKNVKNIGDIALNFTKDYYKTY